MTKTCDFLIIGAGIIGFAIARSLILREPRCSIRILEKESSAGSHASGRNSGVLHAGFYYSEDSLKARFTRQGNQCMREYCEQNKLPINNCGKLVVATNEEEIMGLEELYQRAHINGIDTSLISAEEALELEPRVRTVGKALWSPSTSSVNPRDIMRALESELVAAGVKIEKGVAYIASNGELVETSNGVYATGHLINAAGLYADHIAHQFGFGKKYRVTPFKGLYLYGNQKIGQFKRHIYPVPNLKNPFLGVHFTLTVDADVKIGPTAIPAFWKEQYGGLKGFNISETCQMIRNNLSLLVQDPIGYSSLATQEVSKYFKTKMVKDAARLATQVDASMFNGWGSPGIRAQLMDVEKRALVNDFVVEGNAGSTHILNAVSPAFTCAFPFADYVTDRIYI